MYSMLKTRQNARGETFGLFALLNNFATPYATWLLDDRGNKLQGHYCRTLEEAEASLTVRSGRAA